MLVTAVDGRLWAWWGMKPSVKAVTMRQELVVESLV